MFCGWTPQILVNIDTQACTSKNVLLIHECFWCTWEYYSNRKELNDFVVDFYKPMDIVRLIKVPVSEDLNIVLFKGDTIQMPQY